MPSSCHCQTSNHSVAHAVIPVCLVTLHVSQCSASSLYSSCVFKWLDYFLRLQYHRTSLYALPRSRQCIVLSTVLCVHTPHQSRTELGLPCPLSMKPPATKAVMGNSHVQSISSMYSVPANSIDTALQVTFWLIAAHLKHAGIRPEGRT